MNSENFPFGQKIVWQPRQEWIEQSNIAALIKKSALSSYSQLLEKSVADPAWFWKQVLDDLDIQFYQPYTNILDLSSGIQFPKWCVDGKMNIIHNCLDKWMKTNKADQPAIKYESESGKTEYITYRELNKSVSQCANGLRQIGIGKGDAVGLFMPMVPELIISFLAIIKIGGVVLPLFSGYGPKAISTRLNDAGARAVFTVDFASRRGKKNKMEDTALEAVSEVSTIQHLIIKDTESTVYDSVSGINILSWQDFISGQSDQADTEQTSAEDILMLIYTSGTTGKPKGAVHTHCGFPVKSAQDMYHAMDVKPLDTMYWMTDMGWMMGPWQVFGTLLIGASMLLYDGAPDFPDIERVWQLVEKHGVTHLGVSPTLIRTLKTFGTEAVKKYDFSTLRAAASTGSPWDPDSWMWFFQNVLNGEKPIFNYSGGTEISGGILCGNLFTAMKPGSFSGPVPGMDADVVNEQGDSVQNEVGELVIRKPWIGMTRGFWNDNERYLETYWQRFANIWLHGDFAAIDGDGLWYILGRSDDTIKVAGKRIGPAEVESILNSHYQVVESAVIGVPDPIKGESLVCFCVIVGTVPDIENLRTELNNLVTRELGKPMKPKEIKFTTALPKTRNAKVMHRLIRSVYSGNESGDVSNLENPQTLEAIKAAY